MLSDGPLDETIIEDVSDSIGTEFRSKYGFITVICVIAATFFTGFVINELLRQPVRFFRRNVLRRLFPDIY